MSLPAIFRTAARLEHDVALAWHADARDGLPVRFEAAVEATLAEAAAAPDRFPLADGEVREAPVDGFPYCFYYRVRAGRLVVLAVYHQSRDPDGWQERV